MSVNKKYVLNISTIDSPGAYKLQGFLCLVSRCIVSPSKSGCDGEVARSKRRRRSGHGDAETAAQIHSDSQLREP